MPSIGHIKTTETIPPSRIVKEKKTKVNFQTGKIKVLFTIDLGTVQSGGSSSTRGTFSRSSSRLTRHCISDPFDKQASNMSLQLSTVLFKLDNWRRRKR
jgi:hypothetical protein